MTVESGQMQIAPSILAADFARLADEIDRLGTDADWVHVDVMDNHFVPNLTLGLPVVESLLKHTSLPLDCHLMIDDPDRWAPAYAEAGARSVTFHAEAADAPVRLARALRSAGARAGLALKPASPIEPYADLLPEIDMVLVMSVEPGFGGAAPRRVLTSSSPARRSTARTIPPRRFAGCVTGPSGLRPTPGGTSPREHRAGRR
jgi:ribulose-phosphate 3-epimerase